MYNRPKLKQHIYFTKIERRGIYFVIAFMTSILIGSKVTCNYESSTSVDMDKVHSILSQWQELSEQNQKKVKKSRTYTNKPTDHKNEAKTESIPLLKKKVENEPSIIFTFNPNSLPIDSLKLLGFSSKCAQTIYNYREKGGKFRNSNDLKKVYGVDTSLLTKLKPYVKIPEISSKLHKRMKDTLTKTKEMRPKVIASREIAFIDINLADTYEWMQIKGIGIKRAEHIAKKRKELGGFYSKEQIKEVWSISDSLYYTFAEQLIESSKIQKMYINTISQDSLVKHPYFTYKKAMILCNYRLNHGPFHSVQDIRAIRPFSEQFIQKIAPYLDFTTTKLSN